MINNPSTESHELFLCAVNDGDLYRTITYIIKSLAKKMAKGVYDKNRAIDSFYQVAIIVSKDYNRKFGYMFTVTERFSAACELLEYYADDILQATADIALGVKL